MSVVKAIYRTSSASVLDHELIRKYSLEERELIDNAGSGAYSIIKNKLVGKRVLFVIGKGNNGADGLEVARLASLDGVDSYLMYLFDSGSNENVRRRKTLSLPTSDSIDNFDVIVDAIFGFGFKGELDQKLSDIIDSINKSSSYVISLDFPSAMRVKADETIIFMVDKLDLLNPETRENAGRVTLLNPGFPHDELVESRDGIYLLEDKDLTVKPFGIADYKNSRGHVAVVGGSLRYPGAPILAIKSAFKTGAGLVTLVSKEELLLYTFGYYPSVILRKEEEVDFQVYSSIVVGPGWDEGNEKVLEKAIEARKPIVIDADGIKLLKGKTLNNKGIITPHIGEYKRLCSLLDISFDINSADSLLESIHKVASNLECVVILKGSTVWISDGDKTYIYDGCNPSLGVAGSGDVLSGIIGALLSSGESTLSAAINGVILHQMAGVSAHSRYHYYSAEELIGEIKRP